MLRNVLGTEQDGWFGSELGNRARRMSYVAYPSLNGLLINENDDRYLKRDTTAFELGTTVNLANSVTCCERVAKDSVDSEWQTQTRFFKDVVGVMEWKGKGAAAKCLS